MKNNFEIYKNIHYKNIVFISGITRSGKGLLCPIVSSFKNTEKVNVNFFLEQAPYLHAIDKLSTETAIYLLRSGMNLMLYDNALGRNINFRISDYTSVFKFSNPIEYISRLFKSDGDSVFSEMQKDNKLFPMMIHNGVWHSSLLFDAFPALKILHMSRSPIEIVYSWMNKGYGGEFYKNPRSNIVTYVFDGKVLPYYAFGWEKEYLSLNNTDRIIKMIEHLIVQHKKTYKKLCEEHKKNILCVSYRELSSNPESILPSVTSFLNTEVTEFTDKILLQENCPRVFAQEEFHNKIDVIRENATKGMFEHLLEMENVFSSDATSLI